MTGVDFRCPLFPWFLQRLFPFLKTLAGQACVKVCVVHNETAMIPHHNPEVEAPMSLANAAQGSSRSRILPCIDIK